MKEAKLVTMARLEAVAPLLIAQLELGQAVEVQVPGFDAHRDLIRQVVIRSWIWGELTAQEEIDVAKQERLATFADPPALEWSGPPPNSAIEWLRNREALLGKWNRDLDAQVTAVLVQSLETGASRVKMMEALAEVFPTFSARRLEMIARTESTAALTQGRLARFRDPRNNVEAVQFVAIMDARTSDVCRPRDGLILRLDDDRLASNTPPLHINCRSTLVPILIWDLEDLEKGDERLEQRWFGWLKDPDAPKNLREALEKWDTVPPPAKGFGEVAASKPKRKPNPKATTSTTVANPPTENPLRAFVEERKKLGIDDPDDLREIGREVLTNVRSIISDKAPTLERDFRKALKLFGEETAAAQVAELEFVDAQIAQRMGKGTAAQVAEAEEKVFRARERRMNAGRTHDDLKVELVATRSNALGDTLRTVREFGGVSQDWAKGSRAKARASVEKVSQHFPREWLSTSREWGPMKGRELRRGQYGHPRKKGGQADIAVRTGSSEGQRYSTALHEMGHRMENIIPQLGDLAKAYLASRTVGERTQKLSTLLNNPGYSRKERAKPDKFTHAYFGKIYDDDTELISMGLEAAFLGEYNVWEEDVSLLEFVIGALAAL